MLIQTCEIKLCSGLWSLWSGHIPGIINKKAILHDRCFCGNRRVLFQRKLSAQLSTQSNVAVNMKGRSRKPCTYRRTPRRVLGHACLACDECPSPQLSCWMLTSPFCQKLHSKMHKFLRRQVIISLRINSK